MNVAIAGGGIIGLCSAYYLQQAGHQVTLFDGEAIVDGCSAGNAGMVVPSHIVPLAQPGMIARGLRWMLKSTSPFYIKPRLDADLLRWGWLFYRHATPEHVTRSIPVLRDLSFMSKRLYGEMASATDTGPGLDFDYEERGLLMLYKTATAAHDMAEEAEIADRAGVEARILTAAQVQELEPEERVTVRGGVLYPGDAHLDPGKLVGALRAFLHCNGATFREGEAITGFVQRGKRVTAVRSGDEVYPVDALVLAGGAWSPGLARQLGLRLPLQGGKGYSFMLNGASSSLRMPAIMLEARATATPMGAGLRFAGTLEVAGTDRTINMNRVRGIVQSINAYYPDLPVTMPAPETVWRGLRPCSPDGLPYLGRMPQQDNVLMATGHGMMGISLGPATGKLVADCLEERPLGLDISSFRPDRFA